MKIAIDGVPLGVIRTGVGHYTFEIASGIAAAHPEDDFELVSHIPFISDGLANDSPKNLRYIQQPVNALTKHWWTIGLPIYLRHNSIDLFHGTNYEVPLWSRCPTILTIHDLSLFLYPETHEQRRVKRARRRLPTMARLATRIIVPTESVKRDVCAQLPVPDEKVTVIPEAARKCFRPESPVKAKPALERLGIDNDFILYVGAIEPRKNLLTLVKAFREVYEKTDLRPQLVIAGPTAWLADELFDLISRSSIKERLLLTGYLGDEDLRALYSTCTVMCYPALYEGAGLPPLEAMACGAPVITTSTGAISEMVGDAALLFSPTDYHALAANIVELFIDPQLRSALISKGLKRVENFSWDKAAAMTYKLYRDTLNANED